MVKKRETAEGWPVVNGDYVVGDPKSCVAGATLASHLEDVIVDAGAAIARPVKTENLGIEKMIANLISNPNIRFLLLCGSEVQGHITGQSIEVLHAKGVAPDKRKIVGATGAIPYLENVPDEAIERFQQQLEIISMIDSEDVNLIQTKVKDCIEQDPGAAEEEAIIIQLEEDGREVKVTSKSTSESELIYIRKRYRKLNT